MTDYHCYRPIVLVPAVSYSGYSGYSMLLFLVMLNHYCWKMLVNF